MTANQPLLIFTGKKKVLNDRVLAHLHARLKPDQWKYFLEDDAITESQAAALKPAFVLSVLNQRIFKKELLACPLVNFHPAPPRYPGRGSASYALFNQDKDFGATAHFINSSKVDCGPIWRIKNFPIEADSTCDQLFHAAESAAVDLFCEFIDALARGAPLTPNPDLQWSGKPVSRKQFERWLVLDPVRPEEFFRKLRATYHPDFPGPFVEVHGVRFSAVKTDVRDPVTQRWKI